MADCSNSNTKVFTLEVENELRILAGEQSSTIQLLSGLAEIFGAEMIINKEYKLPPRSSIAVFTWQGCSVKVTGRTEAAEVVSDTRTILNVILHAYLQERRIKAEAENTKGPVTLIVGPKDVGKSTLCHFLLNYAVRLGRRPIFVDLDVGHSSIGVPGSIGFLEVVKAADIAQGFDDQNATVYHYGYKSPGDKMALYFLLLRQLGIIVQSHLKYARKNKKSSGVVINSCGWVRGHGYKAITFAAMAFEIDILCVIGEERLYAQLLKDMPSNVKVHYIPKMSGVVQRSCTLRSKTWNLRILDYFFGPANNLHPSLFDINFSAVHVVTVLFHPLADDFHSRDVTMNSIDIQPVALSEKLVNQVLGMSSAESVSDRKMLMGVVGFVWVKHVDINRGVITVLAPQPSPLPTKILLLGNIRLIEQI